MSRGLRLFLFRLLVVSTFGLDGLPAHAGKLGDACHRIAARLNFGPKPVLPQAAPSTSISRTPKSLSERPRIPIPGSFNVQAFRLAAQEQLPAQLVVKLDEYLMAFKKTGGRIDEGSWGISFADVGPGGNPLIRMNTALLKSKMLPELAATLLHEIDHVLVMQRHVRSYRKSNPTKSGADAWREIARTSSNPSITEHLETRAGNVEAWAYDQQPALSRDHKRILQKIHHYPQREALRRVLLWEEHTLARLKSPELSLSAKEELESKLRSLRYQRKSSLQKVMLKMKEVEESWGNPQKMFNEHFDYWRSFGFQNDEFFVAFREDFMAVYFEISGRKP